MVIADYSGKFLNCDTAKDSDIIEIIGEGSYTDKDYEGKKSNSLDIPVRNGPKELIYTPNMDSGKKLVKAFGQDTAKWIGQKFQITIVKVKRFGNIKEQLEITPITAKKV